MLHNILKEMQLFSSKGKTGAVKSLDENFVVFYFKWTTVEQRLTFWGKNHEIWRFKCSKKIFLLLTLFYYYYSGGFIFHLMLCTLFIKDCGLCFLTFTAPQQGVFFPGQRQAVSATDNTDRKATPLGRCSGVGWNRLISLNQAWWWICVCQETGRLCYAHLPQRLIGRVCTRGKILSELSLIKSDDL